MVVCVKRNITTNYDHDQVGMIAPDGAHQSFHLEHEANLIYPNQLMNAQPENMPVYVKNLCSFDI